MLRKYINSLQGRMFDPSRVLLATLETDMERACADAGEPCVEAGDFGGKSPTVERQGDVCPKEGCAPSGGAKRLGYGAEEEKGAEGSMIGGGELTRGINVVVVGLGVIVIGDGSRVMEILVPEEDGANDLEW